MNGNNVDSGIRAMDAAHNDVRETPADANGSDAMLFKDFLSGGQKLPANLSMGDGAGAVVDHNNFPDSFLNDGTLKTHDLVGTAEDAAREMIESGHPEFSGPVSDADSYNAYMLSDNTRYNFETGTVQVLTDRVEGGVAWQNISDVSPELAATVSNDIIDANNRRLEAQSFADDMSGGNNTPSEASPSAPAASPVANTPASANGQQSESDGTASVSVDTQAPLGVGAGSQEGSTITESPSGNLSTSDDGLVEVGSTSENPLTDDDGFQEIPTEDIVGDGTVAVDYEDYTITAATQNGVIAISDGEETTYTSVDSVTGESSTVDEDGNPAEPALDVEINLGSINAEDQNPAATVEVLVEGRPLYTVANQSEVPTLYDYGSGASSGPQTIYGPDGQTLSQNQPVQASEFAAPHPGTVTDIPEALPLDNVTPLPNGMDPRPGGMPLPEEIEVPAGAITVSDNSSGSGGTPVNQPNTTTQGTTLGPVTQPPADPLDPLKDLTDSPVIVSDAVPVITTTTTTSTPTTDNQMNTGSVTNTTETDPGTTVGPVTQPPADPLDPLNGLTNSPVIVSDPEPVVTTTTTNSQNSQDYDNNTNTTETETETEGGESEPGVDRY